MKTQIGLLGRIQDLDIQIDELQRRVNDKQMQADLLDKELRQIEETLVELESQHTVQAGRRRALEASYSEHQESLAQLAAKCETEATDPHLAAIPPEIVRERSVAARLGAELRIVASKADRLREQTATCRSERAALTRQLSEIQQEGNRLDAGMKKELTALRRQKRALMGRVPPQLQEMFERAAASHQGEGIAPLVLLRARREDYACGGGNMAVTPQVIQDVTGTGELTPCNVCGRLLYLDGEED